MGTVTVERPRARERTEPPSSRPRSTVLPIVAVWTIALYALIALVLRPEGSPSLGARAFAFVVVLAVAGTLDIAIRRRIATGASMTVTGFAMLAVAGGIVAPRVIAGITAREVVGIVAVVGGIVLFVRGWSVLLGRFRHRTVRLAIAAVATLLVAQLVLLPVGAALVATQRVRPTSSGTTPGELGFAFEDVRITADDGARLAAWWIPSSNGAAVILLPGAGSTRDDVLAEAELVADHGYGALLLDARGHGDSEGRSMEFGWGHEQDVSAAISWVLDRPGIERVGLYGLSMGGEVALTTAALDPRVDAVVAEGASARTWDDAAEEPDPHPVGLANAWLTFVATDLLTPASPPLPLLELVPSIDAPTLLIAGSPANERKLDALYAEAAADRITLWAIDAPHVGGLATHPDAYADRVLGHLDAALLGA
jgi:pimeloyl-ACP methyl ester carboxylesterase